jgi:hypothetical protein
MAAAATGGAVTAPGPEPPAYSTPNLCTSLPLGEDGDSEAPALRPIDPDDPDVRKLAYIEVARQRGMPWKMIAAALKVPDEYAAKRLRRELAHRIRLKQAGIADPPPAPATVSYPGADDAVKLVPAKPRKRKPKGHRRK